MLGDTLNAVLTGGRYFFVIYLIFTCEPADGLTGGAFYSDTGVAGPSGSPTRYHTTSSAVKPMR